MSSIKLSNPKRNNSNKRNKSSWFDYYAGYSPEFVEDALNYLNLSLDSVILDPWNGSGTTTQIAEDLGYRAIGYDINPVMLIVAKAKGIDNKYLKNVEEEAHELIDESHNCVIEGTNDDPLSIWLHPSSVLIFRKLEMAILNKNLVSDKGKLQKYNFESISSKVAFYYLGLFKTIKKLLFPFRSSNPTWIKRPKLTSERMKINEDEVFESFLTSMTEMVSSIGTERSKKKVKNRAIISVNTSESLPLSSNSVDAIITSPPYCTRIDYAIATVLELAILGFSSENYLTELRNKMIGTPTIIKEPIEIKKEWGTFANTFLKLVAEHESKASRSYYYKVYLQYFNSMYNSIKEINRVMKGGSYCILVVQDSYYKDILIDLSTIFSEMGESLSWRVENKISYQNKRTLASIHQDTRKYRKSSAVSESALIFQKVN